MNCRLWLLLVSLGALATPLLARVGGGESYSGGGSSSGGGGGDGGGGGEILYLLFRLLFWLTVNHPAIGIPVDIVVIIVLIRWFSSKGSASKDSRVFSSAAVPPSPYAGGAGGRDISELRKFDPNFSEVVFTDFCYSLYGRVHHARGQNKLDNFAPYLSPAARASLVRMGAGWVGGIVIGSFKISDVRGLDSPTVIVVVDFESNYTEMGAQSMKRYYVRERWLLERGRDVLSPTPEHARAEHCPKCGAALQTRTDGSCAYCGTKITNGSFDWFVRSIETRERSERPPNLLGHAPEQGTDLWTIYQPGLPQKWAAFQQQHPEFDAGAFDQRVRLIATELQAAWTSHEWERARAYETDALFQMHRYWIDEYKRQRLRNVVDAYTITEVDIAKVTSDAFYDAITVRLHANGRDYTVDDSGNVVSGSKTFVRTWTEYWTLIRGRGTKKAVTTTPTCPNCGAELKVSETGICAYCGGKITSGDFDWVLSRIEQDESYRG
jgi:hypothetical protein